MSCSIYPGILPWITDRVYDRLVASKIGTMSEFCRLSDDQILFNTGLEFDEIEKTRRFFMGRVERVLFTTTLFILIYRFSSSKSKYQLRNFCVDPN